jgi:transcriptional regulator with XRE-family HTH domain
MPDLDAVIAANIRTERVRRGWRQADLSRRLDWSVGTVCDVETGRRRVQATDLPKLCRAFGVPLNALLERADPADMHALRLTGEG